jgi:hypothetical protein
MQVDDGHGEKGTTGERPARISTPALSEIQAALKAYCSAVETGDLSQSAENLLGEITMTAKALATSTSSSKQAK